MRARRRRMVADQPGTGVVPGWSCCQPVTLVQPVKVGGYPVQVPMFR